MKLLCCVHDDYKREILSLEICTLMGCNAAQSVARILFQTS